MIDQHPWRNYAAYLLYYHWVEARQTSAESTLTAIHARLVKDFENTPSARYVEASYASYFTLEVGSPFPDFAFRSADDSSLVLTNANYRGHPLLVVFWATWCSPCIAEMPSLHQTYERFGNAGLKMLSVALSNEPDQIVRFRKAGRPMPWSVAFISKEVVSNSSTRYQLGTHVLVDPAGKIVMVDSLLLGSERDSVLAQFVSSKGALAGQARRGDGITE
jgi:thiol-disulfide isomerase/thioredoxin